MEGTESAYCTASGMGAISAAILQLCSSGDHVVASNTLYGGTFAFMHDYLPTKTGIRTSFVDINDLDAVERAFTERTKAVYVETIANPTLRVADIPKLKQIAARHGVPLIVDNTFSPMVLSPVPLGADIVVHSLTKFIGGASDLIAGAICGSTDFIKELMDLHTGSLMILGPTMDPSVAFKISMRVPHLGLRMREHSRRAQIFAERLHEMGMHVAYPGLPSHPDHELMMRLRNDDFGCGGLLTLDLGTLERANRFMELAQNKDRFGYMAVSLGYFDTLMSASGASTSSELPEEAKAEAGISPGLVRISMGYTGSLEQRWRQFSDALEELDLVPSGAGTAGG
jgi:methionine-gamma-lyase